MKAADSFENAPLLVHRLWMEGPEAYARMPRVAAFALLLFVTYASRFTLALIGGVVLAYLSSVAFIFGAVGVAWVFSSVPARARRVDKLYSDALNAFDDDPHTMAHEIRKRLDVACDWRWHLLTSAFLALVFLIAAYFAFFGDELAWVSSLRPVWFSDDIYRTGAGVPGFIVVAWFALLIALALGSAAWILILEIRVLPYLAERSVPPLPEALRAKLRGIADFHVQVARDWSVGAILFVILFFVQPDIFSIVIVAAVILTALVIFFVPQVHLRRAILRAHRRAVDIALFEWRRATERDGRSSSVELVATLSDATVVPTYWVYGSGALALWLIAQLTALVALGLQVWGVLSSPSGG